jgi:hypothetical protein
VPRWLAHSAESKRKLGEALAQILVLVIVVMWCVGWFASLLP